MKPCTNFSAPPPVSRAPPPPFLSSSLNSSPEYYVVMYVMVLCTIVYSCCISIFGFIYLSAKFVSWNNQTVIYLITVSRYSSTYPC